MNSTLLKLALELNNTGVSRLETGDAESAVMIFQEALTMLKHAQSEFEISGDHEPSFATIQVGIKPGFCAERNSFRLKESDWALPSLLTADNYIYDRALLIEIDDIHDDATHQVEATKSSVALWQCIICFNLGQTCHEKGRQLGRSVTLNQAEAFYSCCLTLLRQQTCAHGDDNILSSALFLALFALNNKANIHFDYCQYDKAGSCFRTLAKILQASPPRLSIPPRISEEIMLNLMLMVTPRAAHSA